MSNRQVVLKSHPNGVPLPEDFELVERVVPEVGIGLSSLSTNRYINAETPR